MPSTRRLEGILAAYWKLDSAYGATVGADSIGSNVLNVGLVGSATGKVNEAALFTRASSQYLGIASNATLQSLKSVAFWIKFTTISNDMTIVHKGTTATAANSSVWIKYDTGNNRIQFQVGDGAGNSATASTSGITFATGTWYFVCCRYDTAAGKLSISVNGTVYANASASITQYVETGTFYLGRSASGDYLDGTLDEVCVSTSSFTIAEELTLYNGGNGTSPPFLEGPIGASSSSGRYPRRLPPSFAQAGNGKLFIAYGDEGVRKWDGLASTFAFAGVPAPTSKPTLAGSGEGRIIGDRYAYLRYVDADSRVSNLSPISDVVHVHGTQKAITGATNAAPIVITSASHGLATGERVLIEGVQGNKAANGLWDVVKVSTDTFSLVGSAGDGEYTGTNSGSIQCTTLQQGAAAVNEVQTITASSTPSGGTWTISFNGSPTTALAHDANAATVQTALRLLPSIAGANVSVSGGPLGSAAFTLTFSGTLAGANQPAVTVDTASLLGASVSVTVSTDTEGSAGASEVQQFQLYGTPTGGTFTVSLDGVTSGAIAYNASNATIQTALEAMSVIGTGNVTVSGSGIPANAAVVTFGSGRANQNINQMTIDGSSLTGGGISITMSTPTPGVTGLSTNNDAFWKFDESSGTRYSSVGSFDLTGVAPNPSSVSGKIGNATSWGSGGGYFQNYNETLANANRSFSIAMWVKLGSASSTCHIASGIAGQFTSWAVQYTGNRFAFYVYDDALNSYIATADTFGAPSAGTWYFVVGTYDNTTKVVSISVNAGTADTTTLSGTPQGNSTAGTNRVLFGPVTSTGGLTLDETGMWSTALSSARITNLYNSGSGRTTPFTAGTNEVQRITIAGTPSQGTFTLTFGGQTTSAIAYNATAANVVSALEALSTIGSGNVTGANGPLPGTAVNITFTGTLAETDVAAMTANANGLTTSFSTTTAGSPVRSEVQRLTPSTTATGGTFTVTFGANTTSAQSYSVTASSLQSALEGLASIGAGNITVTGGPFSSGNAFVCTFGGTLANANQNAMTVASSLTGATPSVTVATTTDGAAGVNEKQQFFTQGTINGGTWTATLDTATSAAIAFDATAATIQTAIQAMSTVGTSNATATGGPLHVAPVIVEFVGSKAATAISEMTTTNTNIVAGGWSRGASTITYSSLNVPTDRRVTKRQVLRNKYGNASTFYIDLDTTDLTSTSLTSVNTDEMLGTAVPLQDANGFDLNVVRHGEPPNTKRAIAHFLNRMFLAVNHVNTLGEITATASSASIVGQDAFFRTAFDNRTLYPQGTSNTQDYPIDSLSVNTQTITSSSTYNGTTANGIKYAIQSAAPDDLTLYFSELDDPESWNVLNGLTLTRDEQDGAMTGLLPLVTSLLVLFEHRTYKLTFRASPLLSSNPEFGGDGRIIPASWRGCVNHRCAVKAGGVAYLLDNKGIYSYDDSAVEELSDPIDPMFAAGHAWSIYWPAKDFFHAVYDAENDTVKWFVVIGDGMYPRHAICWHTTRKRFWIEEYPWPITSSVLGHLDGRQVVFYGSTHRRVFVASENLDAIDVDANTGNTLRGTVTSALGCTLTDSTATFPSSLANVPIVIVSGKGAGQQNIIVSRDSATKVTLLRPWTTAPDTTSTYQIGGIKWLWKSSMMRLSEAGSEVLRGVQTTFTPTTRASTVLLRKYADFSAAADTFAVDYTSDGITTTKDSDQIKLDFTTTRGFVEISSDSFFAGRGAHVRHQTIELTGTTNGERQRISQINVLGVES